MLSGFVLLVLEYCSAVWCSASDWHLKLLDRAVSGAHFLTVWVWHCSLSICAVLYTVRSGVTQRTLLMVLYLDHMLVRVTRSALVAHRCTYAPPCCRTSQYRRTVIHLSVSLWNDLADPVFDGVGLACSRAGPMLFYWPQLLYPYTIVFYYFSFSLLSVYWLVLCDWGLRSDRVYIPLSTLHWRALLIIIILIM